MILASGRGKRLSPLTDQQPKSLLPVANRPILDYLLAAVDAVRFTEIYVTLGYARDAMQDYLTTLSLHGDLIPVEAPNWQQGPLASFESVLPFLSKTSPWVLLPGDLYISKENLRLLTTTSADVALLYDPFSHRPGTLLQLDASEHVSVLTQSSAYLAGYYPGLPALRATTRFFENTIRNTTDSASTVFTLLQQWLMQDQSLQGIPITDRVWCDVDSVTNLVALNAHLLAEGWPPQPFPPGTYLPPGTSMEGPLQSATLTLGKEAKIEGPVLLGPRVHVGENCIIDNGTTLGRHTIVYSNSVLSRCITLPDTHVPVNTDLSGAILDARGNVFYST